MKNRHRFARPFSLLLGVLMLAVLSRCGAEEEATPAPEPTEAAEPTEANLSVQSQIETIDRLLGRTVPGNIAYNAPDSVSLDNTMEIQLLLSPSLASGELEQMISEVGEVVTGSVQVTLWMEADLKSEDPDAFDIVAYHEDAKQLVSNVEPTEWKWAVKAREAGRQNLILTLYRLIDYEGEENWRRLVEYENSIQVSVTFWQRLAQFDWKWIVGLILASVLFPLLVWAVQRRLGGEG